MHRICKGFSIFCCVQNEKRNFSHANQIYGILFISSSSRLFYTCSFYTEQKTIYDGGTSSHINILKKGRYEDERRIVRNFVDGFSGCKVHPQQND